jgi:PAS domain S-box-containing protein
MLEETQAQLGSVLDSATDVIIYASASGKILDVNASVEQVLGYRPEEVVGKHFVRLGILRLQDIPQVVMLFRKAIRSKNADQFVELELKHKNGGSVFVEVGTQFIIRDGKVKGIVSIFRDITERRRVLHELTTAKKEAEAANRVKSEFLANMSHEVRTPLTAILGFADVLTEGATDQAVAEAARTIRRNGDHLLQVIDDILDLSKIEAGKLQVARTEVSPAEIVENAISLMRVPAEAKKLSLSAEYCGPIPSVIQSDATRLRQILMNLIGNAVKFTETGGVRLLVRLVESPKPAMLRFDVVDTGIGMSKEDLRKIFASFTQVHASYNRHFGGSGLGLAISKRLAAMLGGTISVQSEPGKGSTFTLAIETGPLEGVRMCEPAGQSALVRSAPCAASPRFPENVSCRILLAEDAPDIQRLVSFLLRKAGAEVEVVENGQLAVDAALRGTGAARPFDLVLMDMQMPVMDGYQATERLRARGYRGRIVALTAHAMKDDRQKCLDAGCDEYLSKPIDRERLLAVVAEEASKGRAKATSANSHRRGDFSRPVAVEGD